MRFQVTTVSLLASALLMFAGSSFAAGKKGHGAAGGKAAKECTDKGGTWDKKTKKCDTTAKDSAPAAGTEETPAPAEKTPDAPAPE